MPTSNSRTALIRPSNPATTTLNHLRPATRKAARRKASAHPRERIPSDHQQLADSSMVSKVHGLGCTMPVIHKDTWDTSMFTIPFILHSCSYFYFPCDGKLRRILNIIANALSFLVAVPLLAKIPLEDTMPHKSPHTNNSHMTPITQISKLPMEVGQLTPTHLTTQTLPTTQMLPMIRTHPRVSVA